MPRPHRNLRRPRSFQPFSPESLERRVLLSVAPATLVKDINTAPAGIVTRDPFSFIPFKGQTYFRATASDTGTEWFRTDGTASGTTLLADIVPGTGSSFQERGGLFTKQMTTAAVVGDTLFFAATTPANGIELWKTDGTAAGTVMVKDIFPGQQPSMPEWLTAVGDTLYFSAEDRNLNRQLWKSDGTAEGTQPVTNFPTGVNTGSLVYPIAALNGKLLFAGDAPDGNDVHGVELYSTDGTAAGTTLLKNINPNGGSAPGIVGNVGNTGGEYAIVGNTMYFSATDEAHGRELWKTDGTPAGTVMVEDLLPGPGYGHPGGMVAIGDSAYFVTTVQGAGQTKAIFRTDPQTGVPTRIGEVELDFAPFVTDGSAGGVFYLVGRHTPYSALYKFDPANPAAGLTLVKDLVNMNGIGIISDIQAIADVNGKAAFITLGPPGDNRIQLWRSDGTAEGTTQLAGFPGASIPDTNAYARGRVVPGANGLAYLAEGRPGITGNTSFPYRTDGTAAGSGFVSDVGVQTFSSNPGEFAYLGDASGRTVFFAQTPQYGRELWVTDGSGAGTALLKDIRSGPSGSNANNSTFSPVLNGRTYFGASSTTGSGTDHTELWTSDGTPGGTYRLKEFGRTTFGLPVFTPMGSKMYFPVENFDLGGIWVTDGTEAGTQRVASHGPVAVIPGPLVPYNGALYYVVFGGSSGTELWKTDGTPAGTAKVKNLPGSTVLQRTTATVMDGVLYFLAPTPTSPLGLWRSDGTPPGTTVVKDVPEQVSDLVPAEHRLLITSGRADLQTTVVWVSDGTPAGTRPLSDLVPELSDFAREISYGSPDPIALDGKVYFFGRELAAPTIWEVWQTDGTAAGTRVVKSFPGMHGIRGRGVLDGRVLFSLRGEAPTQELWRTDGTDAGTEKVQDFGATNLTTLFEPAGDQILFNGYDVDHGVELWSMRRPGAPAQPAAYVFYNNSGLDGHDPAATPADLAAVAYDKTALLPGQTASSANITGYDKGINGVFLDLPAGAAQALAADDFTFEVLGGDGNWHAAPAPQALGAVATPRSSLARYALTWADRAIRNTWLRVTVPANARTGLSSPAVFSFGNLVGETGAGDLTVNAVDLAGIRAHQLAAAGADSPYDLNRDGRVNAVDLALARANQLNAMPTGATVLLSTLARSKRLPRASDGLLE